MSVEDELRKYVKPPMQAASPPKDDPAITARVEELLSELALSWSVDDDGDWIVQSEEGEVVLILGSETLTAVQNLQRLPEKPKKLGEYYGALLSLNAQDNNSAAFFVVSSSTEPNTRMVGIKSEISVRNLDKSELALSLKSVLELSNLWSVHLSGVIR
jgi:hypothetical protein